MASPGPRSADLAICRTGAVLDAAARTPLKELAAGLRRSIDPTRIEIFTGTTSAQSTGPHHGTTARNVQGQPGISSIIDIWPRNVRDDGQVWLPLWGEGNVSECNAAERRML